MFLNLKNYIYTIVFLSVLLIISGCNNSNDNIEEKNRPDSIPSTALWVGGTDGGIYLTIEKNKNDKPSIYRSVIYYSSGGIDYKGKLSINNIKNPSFEHENSQSYSSWDGDTLYLRDGRELKIIGK